MKKYIIAIILLISLSVSSQNPNLFNTERWVKNEPDSLCESYRGCVDVENILSLVKGKNKREVRQLLGKANCISKDMSHIYYTYLLDYNYKKKCRNSENLTFLGPRISLVIKNNKVIEIISVHTGG